MADDTRDTKSEADDHGLGEMKLEEEPLSDEGSDIQPRIPPASLSKRSDSSTPALQRQSSKSESASQTPKSEYSGQDQIEGGDTADLLGIEKPKSSRKSTQKVAFRSPLKFGDLPDATEEAVTVFQVIKECIYGSKYMGSTDHDALDCDCQESWSNGKNHACDEQSDCINRLTKMECVDRSCNCGDGCQNQRFQQKQYANVSVIKTEKKGYGLRANTDLKADDFIFEYIGEVINEPTFRRRTIQYDQEGIKHFYFMSLTKHEFVDATKKGNLGRFCNHSCNPNCYVDKWVVGDKLRMGIFAEKPIEAGEELVFNYNVDRYGADPQPCYCGEPNCTGFIGGKTQTERATKLSHATIEALGIDDGDGWDVAVAKKPRKKKTGENDEEYVNNVQSKELNEEGVRKVMATLMQCKEKWIAVKLLGRIQKCNDDRVRNRVVQMHGYQILRTTLVMFQDDHNVILQILDILYKFPRLTKNKISDSKIEATVASLTTSEHEDVAFEAKRLIEDWSKLQVAYRIPRKKFDPNAAVSVFERRNEEPARVVIERPASRTIVVPTGPRVGGGNSSQRSSFLPARPPPVRRPISNALPPGWFLADAQGTPYYYSKDGQTTWVRPTLPANQPPPPPKEIPKSIKTAKQLQDIIDGIGRPTPGTRTPSQSALNTLSNTPSGAEATKPVEKWRTLSKEKQMKVYENSLSRHVIHVMNKYTKKLPKEDLKRFAKEISKKLVASDFKNNRVGNPEVIDEKKEKSVKKYVKEYFDKAVEKHNAREKRQREKEKAKAEDPKLNGSKTEEPLKDDDIQSPMELSDTEADIEMNASLLADPSPSVSVENSDSLDLKRKRTEDDLGSAQVDGDGKRLKESPPPPPPPPPAGELPVDLLVQEDESQATPVEETEEQRALREQEEALMRENEEAMAMDMDGSLKADEELVNGHSHGLNGLTSASIPSEAGRTI